MKLKKHILCLALSAALMLSCNISSAATNIKSFRDVSPDNWAYESIMATTNMGLFSGTSSPINGVGTFSPDTIMSRAQFLVVLSSYLYPDEVKVAASTPGATWYSNHYIIALKHGLLSESELDNGNLTKDCTRQEMAMLLTRAAKLGLGEAPRDYVPVSQIADYTSIDPFYQEYVHFAYSMGFLAGVDAKGTFNPYGVLTRSQAALVIHRLVEPSTRSVTPKNEVGSFTWPNGITYEGEYSNGEANGYGKMTFPGIGTYIGYFESGKRSGIGTFAWDIGDRYVGNWNKDVMEGAGTYTFSDGYVIRGTWQDNAIKIKNLAMNTASVELTVGSNEQIVALCEPYYVTDEIIWTTSNKSVADISYKDNLCTITGTSAGHTTITAKTADGKKCTCKVTVVKPTIPVTQIVLNYGDYSLDVGDRLTLDATILPTNATNDDVTWSSSNTSVASVSSSGKVTAKKEGITVISAQGENNLTATCYITVYDSIKNLFDGRWDIYDGYSDGSKEYDFSWDCCIFDTDDMTVSFPDASFIDYAYETLDVVHNENYTLEATYEGSLYSYELSFTSITEDKIILEEHRYWYTDEFRTNPLTSYYILERQ